MICALRCLSEKVKQRLGAGFLLVRCVGFICRVFRLFFESSAPFICYGRGEETCWNIETIIMKTDIPVAILARSF